MTVFAGKDPSRALATSSLKPEDCVPDWSDLDDSNKTVLGEWYTFFSKRYNQVGKVSRPSREGEYVSVLLQHASTDNCIARSPAQQILDLKVSHSIIRRVPNDGWIVGPYTTTFMLLSSHLPLPNLSSGSFL